MFFESFNLTKKILKTRFLKLEINVFIVLVLGWEGHVPPTKHWSNENIKVNGRVREYFWKDIYSTSFLKIWFLKRYWKIDLFHFFKDTKNKVSKSAVTVH